MVTTIMASQTLFTCEVCLGRRIDLLVCSFSLFLLVGCGAPELSEEEKAFYRRAHSIRAGALVQDARRLLDEPSRVTDADAGCINPAAEKEWIYEDFMSNGVRKKLHAMPIVFCVSTDGKILEVLDIER